MFDEHYDATRKANIFTFRVTYSTGDEVPSFEICEFCRNIDKMLGYNLFFLILFLQFTYLQVSSTAGFKFVGPGFG